MWQKKTYHFLPNISICKLNAISDIGFPAINNYKFVVRYKPIRTLWNSWFYSKPRKLSSLTTTYNIFLKNILQAASTVAVDFRTFLASRGDPILDSRDSKFRPATDHQRNNCRTRAALSLPPFLPPYRYQIPQKQGITLRLQSWYLILNHPFLGSILNLQFLIHTLSSLE